MLRPLRITLEIIASLVGIAIVLSLFLFWRLSAGPVKSAFLTPYIETGIENIVPGTQVQIAHTLLTWDDATRSIALHTDGLRITEKNDAVIAEIPVLDIQLNAIGILFGQFLPTELTVEHPQIRLERRADSSFYFGGMTAESGGNDDIKDSLARAVDNLAHAVFTHALRVSHAVFDVHDTVTNSDWSVNIPEIALERSGGDLTGHVAIDVTQKDQVSTIDVHYTYDRANARHRLVTRFSDITSAFFAGGHPATLGLAQAAIFDLPLTGEITLALDNGLNIASGSAQLHGDKGLLNDPDFWDKPRAVKSLDIKADYDRQTGRLNIPAAAIDFGGPHLVLSATGTASAHSPSTMDIGLSVQIDNWPMDQYENLWPKPIIPDARAWIAANLSKGKFDHGEATFKGTLDWHNPDNINFTEGKGRVTASGGTVKYVEGLPPVEGVSAEGLFDLNRMTVQISGGGIGDIRLMPFTIGITGFEDNVQNIDIPLKVTGPVPSILKLINEPPLGYAKAIGLSPDDVSGKAEAQVTFRFPLLKSLNMKDMGIKAMATLSGVSSSKLVRGIDITQGNLALNLTADGFDIKGPAILNKMPLQISWAQSFSENSGKPLRQATLTGAITSDQWHALGVDVFNGTRGPMALSLQMTQPDRIKTLFSGTLDMTSADVKVDQLNWKKPAGIPGFAQFTAEMPADKDIDVKSIDIHGPQMNIEGHALLSADDGHVLSLNLKPMVVGRTNAALHFSRLDGDNGALHFDAEGKSFDVSGLKGGKDPDHADPQPKEYHLKVGTLYTSENGFIANAEGYAIRDPQGWNEISLHGLADGGHPLDVELTPKKDGSRSFAITCDDFGKALKGMGFTDTVRDGKLDIHGESDPDNPRAIVGEAKIGSFVVGHLPVLAVLMNAASPFGFAGLFTGSMDFDQLKGKFRWEKDTVRLIGLHAAGASVGINADGHVDMDTGEANLYGTMVPFSVVNGILGSIPLIGNLITGGEGQGFFAVSYRIKGPLGDPDISVNPVSLLTPGFLRNLFFGGDDSEETPDSKPPASP